MAEETLLAFLRRRLVTVEGPEGSGKTTFALRLREALVSLGHAVVFTREPGGTPLGERVRAFLLGEESAGVDPLSEALFYAAVRREHVVRVIRPALEAGRVVLVDRFVDSSLVYQGMVRGAGVERVRAINEVVLEGLWPSLTFYLDLPVEEALERLTRDKERVYSRFDRLDASFHAFVREGYERLVRSEPRFVRLDARLAPEELVQRALPILTRHLAGEAPLP
ncbi:MAG: Thymidylate kinase [Brockia lithotrophica]|uniref:Thymidylate kinase n=1 Tax=Brockia lithotrophica TaxID=933949 RepID=A0A2T5GB05_9BACL|nr:dTMP kinase [Brockia lithotrophica]PTQ53363.1 MAG: Thymidylate kinase [Brockia lithotrophica]